LFFAISLSGEKSLTLWCTADLTINDLPDPGHRFSGLLKSTAAGRTKVNNPDVRDGHGALIRIDEYQQTLQQNAKVVEVEVILKL